MKTNIDSKLGQSRLQTSLGSRVRSWLHTHEHTHTYTYKHTRTYTHQHTHEHTHTRIWIQSHKREKEKTQWLGSNRVTVTLLVDRLYYLDITSSWGKAESSWLLQVEDTQSIKLSMTGDQTLFEWKLAVILNDCNDLNNIKNLKSLSL